jgi:hypothetical protein
MTHSQSLLDLLYGLISDGASRARFSADPAAALAAGGVVATSPQAVYEALVRIGDDQDLAQGFDRGAFRSTDVLHVPPPPPPDYFGDRDAHGAAVRYLDNYVSSGFDDDLGPFTGSSAERAAGEDITVDDQFDHPATEEPGHDYAAHEGAEHQYDSHDHGSQIESDAGHHGAFDAGL